MTSYILLATIILISLLCICFIIFSSKLENIMLSKHKKYNSRILKKTSKRNFAESRVRIPPNISAEDVFAANKAEHLNTQPTRAKHKTRSKSKSKTKSKSTIIKAGLFNKLCQQNKVNAIQPTPCNNAKACHTGSMLHLSSLLLVTGIPFVNVIVPAILWLLNKDKHTFVDHQGREVINFQITLSIVQLVFLSLGLAMIYFTPEIPRQILFATKYVRAAFSSILHWPVNIFTFIPFVIGVGLTIRGAVVAYSGIIFKYPMSYAFLPMQAIENVQLLNSDPASEDYMGAKSAPEPNFDLSDDFIVEDESQVTSEPEVSIASDEQSKDDSTDSSDASQAEHQIKFGSFSIG